MKQPDGVRVAFAVFSLAAAACLSGFLVSPSAALERVSLPAGINIAAGGSGCGIEFLPSGSSNEDALRAFPNHAGWPVTVQGGASPPVCADLDPQFPGLEIVVGSLSSGTNLYVFHQDGSLMSGYPVDLGFFIAASPSIADINGDGQLEIVVGDFGGNQVWALHANGTPLPGWPIPVGANVRSTAALADLDPAFPGLEIIVGVQDGTVQAWHYDGTPVPGWPVTAGTFVERCSPAVGDVDGDGDLEVFIGSWYDGSAGSTGGVYGFDAHGVPLAGWPVLTASHASVIASPVLADLDRDGFKEIIAGTYETNARMYVWRRDGTVMTGWPYTVPRGPASGSHISSSPAVGDIDGDGQLEIVNGSCGECGTVYAWERDGTVIPGWPFHANCVIDGSSPVLGDVDGNGTIDIVIGSGSGFTPFGCTVGAPSEAYVLRANGTLLPGWPLTLGTAATPSPALADVDNDGLVEVVMAFSSAVYLWDAPGAYQANRVLWPYYHLGIDHTGDLPPIDPAAVEEPGEAAALPVRQDGLTVWPNPWSGGEPVRFARAGALATEPIAIYDAAGQQVRSLKSGSWDGRDERGTGVSSGVYWIRPSSGSAAHTEEARILVVR